VVWIFSDSVQGRNRVAMEPPARPKGNAIRNRAGGIVPTMNMHRNNTLLPALAGTTLLVVAASGATVAEAQQAPPAGETEPEARYFRWEVTPFVGYRMGGDFDLESVNGGFAGDADLKNHGSFAVAVNLLLDPTSAYELFYSRQETSLKENSPLAPFDLDVEYLHLGGTLVLNEELPVIPYMAGGLGLTRLSPQTGDASEDTRFSVSLAGGLRLPITDRFSARLEARGYLTFVNSDSEFFCASGSFGGVCAVRVKSDTLFQYELLAGASFAF
jgi:opacity protein-like surface antigen